MSVMHKKYFTTVEIFFIASMIGLDFAYGMVVGPLLSATGVLEIIRIDMIIPIMMMLTTRLVVDKFGTLIVYEFVWGVLAMVARPASFAAMPGFLKLIPALTYGIMLDSLMELFKQKLYARILIAGVVGSIVYQFVFTGMRILYGLPWSEAVQILFGIRLVTTIVVNVLAIHLTYLIWTSVERTGWVRRIQSWRTS